MTQRETVRIKAIIFDMGNVLISFDARKSSRAFSKILGVSEQELWEAFFVSDIEKSYTRGEISSEEFFKSVRARFPGRTIDFATFSRLWNDIFTENKDMEGLLAKLKKRYPLYLISNTNELHFEHVKARFNVLKYFTKCFPSHEVGVRKPDPKMFRHVLSDIRLAPKETVFIDDVEEFVEGAKRVGMRAIQFKSLATLEAELRKLGVQV